jgi:acyl-CoA reductase-like NAD-dependent aldehyde dehydrogenase
MIHQALEELKKSVVIRPRYDNFIGGEWVPPVRGQYFTNLTPLTGRPLCEIARSTAEDVEKALDAAHAAKGAWAKISPAERARVLNKIADRMEERLAVLALVETLDNGKPIPRRKPPTCRSPSTTSAISPAASARKKERSARSTTPPTLTTSMSRWASSARSFHGTSRC